MYPKSLPSIRQINHLSITCLASTLIAAVMVVPIAFADPEDCPDYVQETVAALNQSQVAIEVAKSDLADATKRVEVFEMLLKEGAVSKKQYDQAVENQKAAQAKLDAAIATEKAAQAQLETIKEQETCMKELLT
jgi:multidrug resistance efflux pump